MGSLNMEHAESRKPLGELLKDKGLIKQGHINLALQDQTITRQPVGETLERLGFVSQYDIATTVAAQEEREYVDIDEQAPQPETLRLFNLNLCTTHQILPLSHTQHDITIASAAVDIEALERMVIRRTGLRPVILQGERDKIYNAIQHYYYFLENPVSDVIERELALLTEDRDNVRPMEPFIDSLLQLAVKHRATDIHIRPMDRAINVAFRVDGVMRPMFSMASNLKRLTTAIKMKADMDIAEQRLPQDGSFSGKILDTPYDFRVSTTVCPYGENIVIRLLPMRNDLLSLTQLGFSEKDIVLIRRMFNEPFGILLLTGPTGSGKTTTLYSAVRSLDLTERNVITVENPIEYRIPLIRQTQINTRAGYNFANAIRYFLRHDPDVILVGEIRDSETAQTAVSASETGHLVLSTLHTNTAFGAIPRLQSLGVPPFMIADSLVGVVSQRLVRRICPHCKEPHQVTEEESNYLSKFDITAVYKGAGCEVCQDSGYLGRTLVYEILQMNRELASKISHGEPIDAVLEYAEEQGFRNISYSAAEKISKGETSVEEVIRVIGY